MKLALVSLAIKPGTQLVGLCSIATYLEKYANLKGTTIIDRSYGDVIESIENLKPDIIGISAMTLYYSDAVHLAEKLKEKFDIPVIIGGNHISTFPRGLKKCFDIGVVGEAEETMKELVELYSKKGKFLAEDLKEVKGLVFYDNDKLIQTENRPLIFPLDKIPIPDRGYLNKRCFEKRRNFPTGDLDIAFRIITSRGCPYRCVFCSPSIMWGTKVRFHSIDRIADEIEIAIEKYNATYILIDDDLFAVSKDRLKELYTKLKERDLLGKAKFGGRVRANLVDDELCVLLKKLDFVVASLGYESGNEEMLKYLKGGSVSVKDNYNTILLLEKYKLGNFGSFIFASPGETLEQMKDTLKLVKFAYKHHITFMYIYLLQPFPGTEVWEIAKRREVVSDDMDWSALSMFLDGLSETHRPFMLDKDIDMEEFKKIYNKALMYSRLVSMRRFLHVAIKHPIVTLKEIGNPFTFIKKNLFNADTLKLLRQKKKS